MNQALRQGVRTAARRGVNFLQSVVTENGAWPSWRYENTELAGGRELDHPPFTAALGVLALDGRGLAGTRPAGTAALLHRSRGFIVRTMRYPGIWSYPGVPPSTDDTAICALAVGPHPWLRMGRLWGANVKAILSLRDAEGRFVLWLTGEDWPPGLENEADAVVNANVLAYMGDHPEARAAERWVATVVADGREVEASPYYIEAVDLHFAMARAARFRDGLFDETRPILRRRILERLRAGEGFDDSMRTAQALSALDLLAARLDETTRSASLSALVEAQRPDGSWPPCLAWKEPPGWGEYMAATQGAEQQPRGFASEALTTAFCIEAMERATAPRQGRGG